MNTLVDVLGRGNFELKPLNVTPQLKEIPSDAGVVVIAGTGNRIAMWFARLVPHALLLPMIERRMRSAGKPLQKAL